MTNYFLAIAVLHTLLIVAYWFILRNENDYSKLRLFLMSAIVLALVTPLLKLPNYFSLFFDQPEQVVGGLVSVESIEQVVLPLQGKTLGFGDIFYPAYWVISALFLLKFLFNLSQVLLLRIRSQADHMGNQKVFRVSGKDVSFTFFNWIFIDNSTSELNEENEAILRHEKAHAILGHSYDLLLIELFTAFFWWLPTSWFTRAEAKKIHEYQADAYAMQSYSPEWYSSVLISTTLKSHGLSLASSFHDGLILKRLKAMKKHATKLQPWKIVTLALFSTLLFSIIACNEEVDKEIKKMGESSNAITFDQLPAGMQNSLSSIKNDLVFIKLEMKDGQKEIDVTKLQNIDPKLVHMVEVDKSAELVYIAIKKDGSNFDHVAETSKMDGEVFTIVEDPAQFPGGMDNFYGYIAEEIKYPLEARKTGLEGKVYVQFIVETDGSVSEVQTVKGIGGGCDEEAVRVLESSPLFIPAQQRGQKVRQRMVMPIVFKLDRQENKNVGVIIIDNLEPVKEKMIVKSTLENGVWNGVVTDEAGDPVAGVNIVEDGTNSGTVSDKDGTFSYKAQDESHKLVLSHINYGTVKINKVFSED